MPRPTCRFAALTLSLALFAATAHALEYPIGTPQNVGGLEVAAVDLQPIEMEPDDGHMRKASESDIHLEADIRALANNPNGFAEGAWVPYLQVRFELTKVGSGEVIKGAMMPMVASDGPKTEGDHLHFRSRFRLHSPLLQRSRKAPASGLPPGSTGAAVADAGDPSS